MRWLVAFGLTQAIEAPLYWLAIKRSAATPLSLGERAFAALGPSALTHPVVWFVVPWLLPDAGILMRLAVAESFAILAEALFLRAFAVRRALLLSLVVNGLSASVGMALARAGVL